MALPYGLTTWLIGAMCAVAMFHLGRLSRGRPGPDTDVVHALMASAMVAMLAGWLAPSVAGWLAGAFVVLAVGFCCLGVHRFVMDGGGVAAPILAQCTGCLAMAYMLAALVGSWRGLPDVPVTGALLLATVAVAGWAVVRMRRPVAPGAIAAGCQVAMSVTTVCMLVVM